MRKIFLQSTTAIVAGLLMGNITSVQAQTVDDQKDRVLDQIFITATKRTASVQDVSLAVTAYSGELLKDSGVYDLRDLVGLAPSLYLSTSASEVAGVVARIRGIGTTGDNPGLESAVGVFIDGVYRNRNNVGLTELGELDRVEILRGPQGTLFGRNTSAGLLSIFTKKAEYEPSVNASASYGNFDSIRIAAGATGGIVDGVMAARVDVVYTQRDGFLTDKVTGDKFNDRDRFLIRSKLLIEPSTDATFDLIFDYSDRNETCCAAVTIVRGPTAGIIEALGGVLGSGGSPAGSDPFDRLSATTPGRGFDQDVEEWGVSGELNWDIGNATFTSITAYRDWSATRSQDIDFTSLDILYQDDGGFAQTFETFTQEVRLNGVAGPLDWLVGFFYSNEDLSLNTAIRTGADYDDYLAGRITATGLIPGIFQALNPALPPFAAIGLPIENGQGVVDDAFLQDATSWAIFTHNTVELTEGLELTGGIRYTSEKKTLNANLLSNVPACPAALASPALMPPSPLAGAAPLFIGFSCLSLINPLLNGTYNGQRKETEWSGTAAISYRWTDEVLTYFSYSRGYKAGGFNLDRSGLFNPLTATPPFSRMPAASDLEFEPEFVDSFELAVKSQLWGNRATLNVTAFYEDFSNFQLNAFDGVSFLVSNLSKVVTKGVEVEFTALATSDLMLQGGITYANAKYGDNLIDRAGTPQPNLAGQQITNAPKWSITGSATWEKDIPGSGLLGFLHVDFRYSSQFNTGSDLDVEKLQKGFVVFNGRIGIGNQDSNWRLEFWARNLLDKDYIQVAFDGPLQSFPGTPNTGPGSTQTFNAFLAEPRTWGFGIRGDF